MIYTKNVLVPYFIASTRATRRRARQQAVNLKRYTVYGAYTSFWRMKTALLWNAQEEYSDSDTIGAIETEARFAAVDYGNREY